MELSGYNKILVDRFLNRPNVKRGDNTISFYQLYCEIRNYFNECYSKAYYNKKLVNKINNISSNKNISIKNISISLLGNVDDTSEIYISYIDNNEDSVINHCGNSLCRDINGSIYWKYDYPVLDNNTFVNVYDDFMELFDFREKFINNFFTLGVYKEKGNFETYYSTDYSIAYAGIKTKMIFNQRGQIKYEVYTCEPGSFQEIDSIDDEAIAIMKKVSVDIDTLSNFYKIALGYDKKKSLTKKKTI